MTSRIVLALALAACGIEPPPELDATADLDVPDIVGTFTPDGRVYDARGVFAGQFHADGSFEEAPGSLFVFDGAAIVYRGRRFQFDAEGWRELNEGVFTLDDL